MVAEEDCVDSLVLAARQHAATGAYLRALELLSKALRVSSRSATVWYDIGTILARQGSHEDALDAFDHVTDLEPDHAQAFFQKGVLLTHLGRHDEARAAFCRSVELSPHFEALVAPLTKLE